MCHIVISFVHYLLNILETLFVKLFPDDANTPSSHQKT
jgi:hypothetical protein